MRLSRHAITAVLLTALASTVLVLGSTAPASAAWKTSTVVHGAKLQVCKTFVQGRPFLRARLDNRRGEHAHRGGLSRPGQSRTLTARAGRISEVKQLSVNGSRSFSTYVADVDGPGAGGGLDPRDVPRCAV